MARFVPLESLRNPPGGLRAVLSKSEHRLLLDLKSRLHDILLDPSRARFVVDRLFPVAHRGDSTKETEFRELLGQTLFDERLATLERMEATLGRAKPSLGRMVIELSPEEVDLWVYVINDFRILLGTELDIQENGWVDLGPSSSQDPKSFALLLATSGIQGALLQALGVEE